MNTYAYALNNPLIFVDPYGLEGGDVSGPIANMERDRFSKFGEPGSHLRKPNCGCLAKTLGITTAAGTGLAVAGAPTIPKSMVTKGASSRTSIASKYLSKRFPGRLPKFLPKRLPAPTLNRPGAMTNKVGRLFGRWVPWIGWGLLVNDAVQLKLCVKKCLDDGVCTGELPSEANNK